MADPLGASITRNLCDRVYEKRKQGAGEVEDLIKDLNANNQKEQIVDIIDYLTQNYAASPNGNHRKGALIALAAVAIALGTSVIIYFFIFLSY